MMTHVFTSSDHSRTTSFTPFENQHIKVLLLENVNQTAVDLLRKAGFQVEHHSKALPTEELKEKIRDVHVIGIRSKTKLTAELLDCADKLMVIGCFCIGTNQVDLETAAKKGIAVFNSPFSNSRSVAEMTIANIITLSRQIADRNREMHEGVWNKMSAGTFEVRGKTLGIVGYGHIGSQLSVLAEAMGIKVIFYDILPVMPLGSAQCMPSLDKVLQEADFVSLHVPETPETNEMIGEKQLGMMKSKSYLLNASRGTVVVIPALVDALKNGHLAGCAVDVFPKEPLKNGPGFESQLLNCPNTILTPHIGGSTEEAQCAIGIEVASAIEKFISSGNSLNAVNFPQVDMRKVSRDNIVRVINVHKNVPGVLKQINKLLGDFNISKQICDSQGHISYFLADIEIESIQDRDAILFKIGGIQENVLTRIVY